MRELVSFAVGNLVEKSWWDRAVENQVSSVQQNLLHGLPPLDASCLLLSLTVIFVGVAHTGVLMLQHWSLVIVFETWFEPYFRSWREGMRLVRLVVVSIVVRFGVDSVFLEGCVLFERKATEIIRRVLATR